MNTKPSLLELALRSRRALVLGAGGGGDIIQGLPVANFLRLVGLEVLVGGVACSWWEPEGGTPSRSADRMVYGATVYDVAELEPVRTLARHVVQVNSASHFRGRQPAEAALADFLGTEPLVCGLTGGVIGLRDSLTKVIADLGIDLVVGVDIGGDVFHDGAEVMKAHSSMVDFTVIAALSELDVPVVYALGGYGADGEMQPEELDERVARVMRAGGYLGAIGPSQNDVKQMLEACELFPDPILPIAPRAAMGEIGLRRVQTYSPWGTVVRLTPLAATILLFDPKTMIENACTGAASLKATTSLKDIERIYRDELGEYPETHWRPVVSFRRDDV